MEAKFTPGPWATDIEVKTFDGQILDATIYVNHGSGKGGAICIFQHDPEDGLDNTDPEQIANAHLIAAAPELYEALGALENCRQTIHGQFVVSKEGIDRARAALAKARGESQA